MIEDLKTAHAFERGLARKFPGDQQTLRRAPDVSRAGESVQFKIVFEFDLFKFKGEFVAVADFLVDDEADVKTKRLSRVWHFTLCIFEYTNYFSLACLIFSLMRSNIAVSTFSITVMTISVIMLTLVSSSRKFETGKLLVELSILLRRVSRTSSILRETLLSISLSG